MPVCSGLLEGLDFADYNAVAKLMMRRAD